MFLSQEEVIIVNVCEPKQSLKEALNTFNAEQDEDFKVQALDETLDLLDEFDEELRLTGLELDVIDMRIGTLSNDYESDKLVERELEQQRDEVERVRCRLRAESFLVQRRLHELMIRS